MISVVIPVYNTGRYLGRCLDSVVGQTYRDLEILCINDCSSDGSEAILRRYQDSDPRVRVISLTENHGVAFARNLGIDKARGDYIYFMDSDDWLDPDYLEEMYRHAVSTGQDVVVNRNWYYEYDDHAGRVASRSNKDFPDVEGDAVFLSPVLVQTSFYPVVWARLYRLGYLKDNGIRSPLVKCGVDDNYFTSLAEILQPRSYVFSGSFYHYYQRPGSLSRQNDLIWNYTLTFKELLEALRKRGIPPSAAKRFYVLYQFRIENAELFDNLKSYFSEAEADVLEAPWIYRYFDFYAMEMVLSCTDFLSYRRRFPDGVKYRSVDWELNDMPGFMDRFRPGQLTSLPAREALSPNRFDLYSFLYFIGHRDKEPRLARRVYWEAIRSFIPDGKRMRKKEERDLLDLHVARFGELVDSVFGNDRNGTPYRIPVGKGNLPLDGAHIVAALSFHDKEISVIEFATVAENILDYTCFLKHGMSGHVADITAREGIEWLRDPKVMIVRTKEKMDDPEPGSAFYSVDFNLGRRALSRLMSLIGSGETARKGIKGGSRLRVTFVTGLTAPAEGDTRIIEGDADVRRVADLVLTREGRKEWYHGGGLGFLLLDPVERLYDYCRSGLGWKFFRFKNFLANVDLKAWISFYKTVSRLWKREQRGR